MDDAERLECARASYRCVALSQGTRDASTDEPRDATCDERAEHHDGPPVGRRGIPEQRPVPFGPAHDLFSCSADMSSMSSAELPRGTVGHPTYGRRPTCVADVSGFLSPARCPL